MNQLYPPIGRTAQLPVSKARRTWLLTILVLVYASSFIDRIIVAMVGQAIKVELRLSDLELGMLGGLSFALLYAVMSIPFARLAERCNRIKLIAVCTAVWSLMTVLCGFAGNYLQLLACRAGVGVGEAGCTPSAHSVIADYYPQEQRASALAIFSLGVPLGVLVGAVAAGWLLDHHGWRAAFVVIGAPGLVLALLVWLTLREPVRGMSDKRAPAASTVPPFSAVLRRLWARKSFVHVAAGAGLVSFCNYGINLFLPVYFVRVHGMSYTQAGMLFGLTNGGAALIGNALGGYLCDWAGRYDKAWYGRIPAIGFLLAVPLYVAAFLQTDWVVASVLLIGAGVLVFLWSGPTFSIAQSVVEPRMRASASAILILIMNLVGQGMGPVFMGFASDKFAEHVYAGASYALDCPKGRPAAGAADAIVQACGQASATGVRYALLCCVVFFVFSAIHYLRAARHVERDLA